MSRTRREFIKTMGYGAAALSLPQLLTLCKPGELPPNIVFIMSDDHAEQALSCYGSKMIKTPHIDRIAKEGVRFVNSFVTNSICAPSRATMLTGKYSHKNGLRDNRDEFDGSQVTFPKLLQQSGYETAIVGKWHLKSTPTGFDHYDILKGQGQYYNPLFDKNGQEEKLTGYTTDLITERALAWLNGRQQNRPFCLLLHHKAPHRNWMPAPRHFDAFADDLPLPLTLHDDYAGRPAAEAADMRIEDMYLSFDLKLQPGSYDQETGSGGNKTFAENIEQIWKDTYERLTPEQRAAWDAHYQKRNEEFKQAKLQGKDLTEWKYQQYIKDYLRCVLAVDEGVGQVLDWLDKKGQAQNTIVVYTSDQGFYLGEHGWYDKRFMYEESLSMPLVMRYPGMIKAGQIEKRMVMNLDFAPTLLDLAGSQIPDDMQGTSLRGLFTQNKGHWRDGVYYHYYEYPHGWHDVKRHYGIRTERYKLIHFYNDIDLWELYDLKLDPQELRNVYDHPMYVEVRRRLHKELDCLQQLYEDTDIEGVVS